MNRSSSTTTVPSTLGPALVQSPERSAIVEWLETNRFGDFACGTVAGPNTRRQHGLFVTAPFFDGPRMLLLAAVDATLERDDARYALSCHQYAGARHPEGYRHCVRFAANPFPEWRYEVPGAALVARIFLPYDKRCVVCSWSLDSDASDGPCSLTLRPLFAYRAVDSLTRANDQADMTIRPGEGGIFSINPYPECPETFVHCGAAEVRPDPCWYYRFQHPWNVALGRDAEEDLFCPCSLTYRLHPGESAALIAGLERESEYPTLLETHERMRRASLWLPDMEDDQVACALARAADRFVIQPSHAPPGIVTRFPGAHEELRAALIAFRGLLLCTRRLAEARDFIAAAMRRLLDHSEAQAVGDEPLWFIRACEQYVDYSRDWDYLRNDIAPACRALAQRCIEHAPQAGFKLAPDGLLASAPGPVPLTWMNQSLDDWPATPRTGKPVEVNALWHHALGLLSRWMRRQDDAPAARRFAALRDLCGRSFRHRFWNRAEACLYDVVDPDTGSTGPPADPAVRPNQLLAIALPGDLLDRHQATAVLSLVEKRLLTPYGLRTLALEDRAFRPRYGGGPVERAAARHQGPVFPWLIGPYVDAVFRVHGRTPRACARAQVSLETLLSDHLNRACIGQVSELFHGAAPHMPQSAFAHAPAVAELLRAYVEVKGPMW